MELVEKAEKNENRALNFNLGELQFKKSQP